jgi:hypothetical protein
MAPAVDISQCPPYTVQHSILKLCCCWPQVSEAMAANDICNDNANMQLKIRIMLKLADKMEVRGPVSVACTY